MERLRPYWEKIRRFWKRRHLTQILLLIALVAFLLTILFFAWLATRANVESLKEGLSQSTVIYDRYEQKAAEVTANRIGGAKIDQMPQHVKDAITSIEDERFYEHNGFDIKGIARAFFSNLFAGRITGGGSTITQQLAKNALLSPEQTYRRKAEELFLAAKLEKVYKKDEILEMYLNQVYFGSGAWGIGTASERYFNKDIKNVTISEAAVLAGLLQAPNAYDPYNHYDRALKRRNIVLSKMKELNKISKAEYEKAIKDKINLGDGRGSRIKRKFPYYVDAVLDEAIREYGLTQDEILTRGYRIYTELDPNLQTALEKVYSRDWLFPRGRGGQIVQSGAVLVSPETGGVMGVVGGRGEHVFRGFNRATQLKAQPGSTMKPLAVYAPALKEGYSIESELVDEPISFGTYKPQNATRTYSGKVPMYKAVEQSLNVPTVWLLNEIGVSKGAESVEKFGIPVQKDDRNLALALGGMHHGISPLQLASAYSAFANNGKRYDSHFVVKIVGPTGNEIASHKKKSVRVMSRADAKTMTSMLLGVVENGTGKAAKVNGLDIAGKTGSTQLPYADINGTKDQWFAGYTPEVAGAVWLGYDRTDREHYLSTTAAQGTAPIFRAIMQEARPFLKEDTFGITVAGEEKDSVFSKKELIEQTEKLREEVGKATETIKEEAPKWKKALDEGIIRMIDGAGKMAEKLKELRGS
ncbi:PBP1A family penicillin-binding protein [Neobacillus notoginsengisoli]|uniref:PBP1A family penicillin-binding protein n=1 Tax=Neobacillus notoginsengisoli TaxID=1578198 RepID=A0A417YS20_9BACI|nr:PBP1A family penicillin-binding protein [Neobacillus notoginsengisoli]RHW38086.1 PBP1A family penicillin-binding protein [Neobacillus notoginsengisoli]